MLLSDFGPDDEPTFRRQLTENEKAAVAASAVALFILLLVGTATYFGIRRKAQPTPLPSPPRATRVVENRLDRYGPRI